MSKAHEIGFLVELLRLLSRLGTRLCTRLDSVLGSRLDSGLAIEAEWFSASPIASLSSFGWRSGRLRKIANLLISHLPWLRIQCWRPFAFQTLRRLRPTRSCVLGRAFGRAISSLPPSFSGIYLCPEVITEGTSTLNRRRDPGRQARHETAQRAVVRLLVCI